MKAIMKRSELESKYLKIQTQESFKSHKKKWNFSSRLYKKEPKNFYNSMECKNTNDNRQFWKTVEPFLSDKGSQCSQINLVDEDNVISDEKGLSKEFVNFFNMAVKNLDAKGPQVFHVNKDSKPIDITVNKCVDHPSIFKINEYFNGLIESNFLEAILNDIKK